MRDNRLLKRILCLVLLSLTLFCGAMAEQVSFRDINSTDSYVITLEKVKRLNGERSYEHPGYRVQQGMASDGTWIYTDLESKTTGMGSFWKLSPETWEVAETRYDIPVEHCNDLTWNDRLGLFVSANTSPNGKLLTFTDPETMTCFTRELPFRAYAVAYDEVSDRYMVGQVGTTFVITDGEFNVLSRHQLKNPGLARQGSDCDDKYIYFVQNRDDKSEVRIQVYDWDGNFVNQIPVMAYQEIEDMCHIGDDVYLSFYSNGSYIYKATLERVEK